MIGDGIEAVTDHKIILLKTTYSENVIRKALYWMSATTTWLLEEDESHWIVVLTIKNEGDTGKFNRLLNDQVLREKIDNETGMARRSIIKKVLNSLESSL